MNAVDVHSARILVVDDQQPNVELLVNILLEDGYTDIHDTQDPEQVSRLHHEHNFDLILLDLEFPDMDGFEVMQALKKNAKDPYLSVIVLTAHHEHKVRALQAGAKDFISKPFDIVEVLTRIHNILEVRLLYMELDKHAKVLELRVQERTAELQKSEERFRGFTDLASDWYWEQDTAGSFTKVSGPVPEILGIEIDSTAESTSTLLGSGWNAEEQSLLREKIIARESFLDYEFSRSKPDGSLQTFLVSGQPMFDRACNFLGYRGIGVDISVIKEH